MASVINKLTEMTFHAQSHCTYARSFIAVATHLNSETEKPTHSQQMQIFSSVQMPKTFAN